MIRLTVNAQSEPQIHLFNKSIITIGSESSQADLVIPEEGLQPIYLNIIEQNNFPIAINLANDPFISLNGHPFGKKLLNNGDVIVIHGTEILFESINIPKEEEKKSNESTLLDIELPFENEVEALKDEEWHPTSIDKILADIQNITPQPQNSTPPPKHKRQHLKDDYLKDLDDENQQKKIEASPSSLPTKRWVFLLLCSLLAIASIVGGVIYINALDMTQKEEIMAAREVADVSMALIRAQLNHLKPHNHNWSDSEFLNTNLNAILSVPVAFEPEQNTQGRFSKCPYNLRIYTNRDLTRFLLIAQPDPSLLQWLIPKSIIIVDSESMELRGIKDLRSINRLLANANPLEGTNGKEIHKVLKEGNIITLDRLSCPEQGMDFTPPQELALLHPGSENLIYNAPRYCGLGQSMVEKAANLLKTPGSAIDVAALKSEAETFSKLPSLVIYSKEGKKGAWIAQQGIATFAPSAQFLFGYVSIDPSGQVIQSRILEPSKENLENFQLVHEEETSPEIQEMPQTAIAVDIDNPIYLYLSSLAASREKELKVFASNIKSLLNQESHAPIANFKEQIERALYKYNSVDSHHAEQIAQQIKELYKQQEKMNLDEYLVYVKAAGLDPLIGNAKTAGNLEQEWSSLIAEVDRANSFSSLLEIVEKSLNRYDLSDLLDFDHLEFYENEFRNKVLDKIQSLLFSAENKISKHQLTDNEKKKFYALVNHEKIVHQNEREFFISEFERVVEMDEAPRFQLQAMDDIIKSLNKPRAHYQY